jgi:hypothetical protein
MDQIVTIGLDLAKNIFRVHGIDACGKVVIRKPLRRGEMLKFFASLRPCLIGIEACATAHHWGRELGKLGHTIRLMPPAYVKAYVKRGKTDAADAGAICEAVTRPTMRFVAVEGGGGSRVARIEGLPGIGERQQYIRKHEQQVRPANHQESTVDPKLHDEHLSSEHEGDLWKEKRNVDRVQHRGPPSRAHAILAFKPHDREENDFVRQHPGIVRRHLMRAKNGGYADLVFFENKEVADRVLEAEATSPECAIFFGLMVMPDDPDMDVLSYDEVKVYS